MEETATRLEILLEEIPELIATFSEEQLYHKAAPEIWSKKEILGHLIDSAINNLQRFTEAQFMPKPYQYRKYNQNELVRVNKYQELPVFHLVSLWKALNRQIISVMERQTNESLQYAIQLSETETTDLKWLMTDYVDHLVHHQKQIKTR